MFKIEHEFEFKDDYIIVKLEIDYYVDNDGIGEYEFWGSVEKDEGYDYPRIEEMTWDKSNYTEEQNEAIHNNIWKEENIEKFEKKISDSWKEY